MRSSIKVYSVSGELDKIYYYIWKNGKLNGFYIKDMNGTDDGSVKMLFDVDGEPIGYEVVESDVESKPQTFFFRRNLQGDIVAVCHKGGWDIITYAYDAWGGVQVLTMDSDFALCLFALICTPITYRGYNYDVFTGLYYLQSRYYNPTYGRFLNVDSIMKTGEPLGANIFAYCNNNPVNFVDYDGLYSERKFTKSLELVGRYARTIVEEANRFGVDPVVVAGVIVAEQTLNVNFIDSLTDKPLYFIDTSIGIGQVKISTAKEVEKHMGLEPITETIFVFMNQTVWSVPGVGLVSGSYEYALACRLQNDEQNIKFVAAYIAYIQKYWRRVGYDISNRPEILATLYNIGVGEPKPNPQPNSFGSFVGEHYNEIEIILIFGIIFDVLFNGGQ